MRFAPLLLCAVAFCASAPARAEITKFTESPAQPFAEQDKTFDPYVRVTFDVEGALVQDAPAAKTLDKALAGKDGRFEYKFQANVLRPEKRVGKVATLLIETEPENGAGADLLDVARERRMTVVFLSGGFDGLAEPLRAAALGDLVAHLRKNYGIAHIIARGFERKAEFLRNVSDASAGEGKRAPAILDALLLFDRVVGAPVMAMSKPPIVSIGPFAADVYSSSVFWRDDPKFAARDIGTPDDKNGRVYFLAGAAARSGAQIQNCAATPNTLSTAPAMRALLVALDEFVSRGVALPASRYPQKSGGSLVPARDLHWPKLPGVAPPAASDDRFAPAIDADGNETSGLRTPDQAVAIATHVGWNAQKDKAGPPCEAYGASLPFAANKAEREKAGDPRLSLQERFGLRDFYVATVRTVADKLVRERLLLKKDADAYVAQARKAPF
jgi:hypothetical protein